MAPSEVHLLCFGSHCFWILNTLKALGPRLDFHCSFSVSCYFIKFRSVPILISLCSIFRFFSYSFFFFPFNFGAEFQSVVCFFVLTEFLISLHTRCCLLERWWEVCWLTFNIWPRWKALWAGWKHSWNIRTKWHPQSGGKEDSLWPSTG